MVAVLVAVILVLFDLGRTGTNPLNLIQPGVDGPSVEAIRADFPSADLPSNVGLDGQQFYAVARNPFDLDGTAEHLDRPRYRLQRPLLPWLGWLGHPTGGGRGLILSLFAANVAAVAVLASATGSLARQLGGSPWVGALVGLYPGVWWSLRVTVADTLAVGLAVAAVALVRRERTGRAGAIAAAAVLAKETAILVPTGWALARWRDRKRWVPVLLAGAVGVGWAAFLRVRLPGDESVGELTLPFLGLVEAVHDRWLEGDELWGLLGAATGIGVAVAALVRRGLHHPLSVAIALQLAFLAFANGDVLGNDFGAGRSTLAVLALGTIAWFAPGPPTRSPAASRADAARTLQP